MSKKNTASTAGVLNPSAIAFATKPAILSVDGAELKMGMQVFYLPMQSSYSEIEPPHKAKVIEVDLRNRHVTIQIYRGGERTYYANEDDSKNSGKKLFVSRKEAKAVYVARHMERYNEQREEVVKKQEKLAVIAAKVKMVKLW